MTGFTKFLLYSVYFGAVCIGIGIGLWVHPGAGIAAFGLSTAIASFVVGYEPSPKVVGISK